MTAKQVHAEWRDDVEFPGRRLHATIEIDGQSCDLVLSDSTSHTSGIRYISLKVHAPYQGHGNALMLEVNGGSVNDELERRQSTAFPGEAHQFELSSRKSFSRPVRTLAEVYSMSLERDDMMGTYKKGFLSDNSGKRSSMRIMTFIALLVASALALIQAIPSLLISLGHGAAVLPAAKIDNNLVLYFLTAAFGGKVGHKFAETRQKLP